MFKNLGGKADQWGSLYAVYSATQIVGGVLMGYLSDRFGRRFVFLLNMCGAGVSYFMLGNVTTISFLVATRVLVGLVKQTDTIAKALEADLTPKKHRTASLSHCNASEQVGWFLGSMAGSYIVSKYGLLASTNLSACLYVINTVFVFFGLPGKDEECGKDEVALEKVTQDNRSFGDKIKTLYRSRRVLIYVCIKIVTQFVKSGLYSSGAFYLVDRFSLSMEELGKYSGFQGLIGFLLSVIGMSFIVRLVGEDTVILMCIIIAAFLLIVETLNITSSVYIFMIMPMRSLLRTLMTPCIDANFLSSVPKEDRGAALGGLDVILSASRIAAPIVYGYTLDQYGFRVMLMGSTFLCVLVAVLQGMAIVYAEKRKVE